MTLPSRNEPAYRKYKRRWIILGLFSVFSFWVEALWITFSPISVVLSENYGVSVFWTDFLCTSGMAAFVLFGLVPIVLFERWGLRAGVLIGALVSAGGAGLRWAGAFPDRFVVLSIGQFFGAGVGILFVQGAPSLLSARWFADGERSLATNIGCQAAELVRHRSARAHLLNPHPPHPYLFVVSSCSDTKGVAAGFLISGTSIVNLAADLPILLCAQSRPPSPPSASAARAEAEEKENQDRKKPQANREPHDQAMVEEDVASVSPQPSPTPPSITPEVEATSLIDGPSPSPSPGVTTAVTLPAPPDPVSAHEGEATATPVGGPVSPTPVVSTLGTCRQLARWPFVLLVTTSALQVGAYWCITTIISTVLTPLGFQSQDSGWIGALTTGCGILGSLLSAPLVDRFRAYKPIYITTSGLACCALFAFLATTQIWPTSVGAVVASAFVGFVFGSILPESLEYASELSFPVLETTSGTVVATACNGMGLVYNVVVPLLAEHLGSMLWPLIILLCSCLAAFGASILLPTRYLRQEQERIAAQEGASNTVELATLNVHGVEVSQETAPASSAA
ncbi:hypothetical protein PAPYR_1717 [Paratrimastix pyriformis]|uniref:Uncharacterized protein n=1 Tax=Paratrimastix pyriformis TaxID=342808 RepID=A0ABQ8UXZ8_9EUKA|nr:hypothetical protein PAPYR_1717 [Paratrimastix pyriformis]